MNCCNHPDRNATAICTACGKGICNECLSSKSGLCKDCYNVYLQKKVSTAVIYLIALVIIGIIGYYGDFMGRDGMSQQGASCYMLMATCTGIFLISGKIQLPAITFLAMGVNNIGIMMLLVMLIKFIIAVILGAVLMPFIIVWQILTIVLNLSRIKKNNQKEENFSIC